MSLSVLLAVAFVGAALYYVCPLRFRWVLLLLLSLSLIHISEPTRRS